MTVICEACNAPNDDVKESAYQVHDIDTDKQRVYEGALQYPSACGTEKPVASWSEVWQVLMWVLWWYQCLCRIAELYYEKLPNYIQTLLEMSLNAIKTQSDVVARQVARRTLSGERDGGGAREG
eukprot:278018-Rhodomonas_salina.4